MSKKFLPFSGRLAYRRDGRIDITSPDDSLSGFRVTLKPGTDSHSVAEEALQDAGVTQPTSKEYYAQDLYGGDHSGLLLGLTEEGSPLRILVPKPGGAIWILGTDPQKDVFLALLKNRLGELGAPDLSAFSGHPRYPVMKTVPDDLCLSDDMESAEEALDILIQESKSKPRGSLQFLIFPYLSQGYRALSNYRESLGAANVVPIFSSSDGVRSVDKDRDTVIFFAGGSTEHWHSGVPKASDWASTVPIGRAFIRLPGMKTAERFRVA